MRFLLAGHIYGRGGIQTHLRWLAHILAGEGHAVYLLPTLPPRPGEEAAGELQRLGATVYSRPPAVAGRRLANWRQLAQMGDFVRRCRPHVYYVVGAGWVSTLLRPLAAPAARAIFFEVMSGHWYHWPDPRVLARYCFDEVVGQSPRVNAVFRREFSWGKPAVSLPAIPEPMERVAHVPPAPRRRVALGRARAALFSRLAWHKRALWLVRQWPLLQDVLAELHIHGSGPDEQPIRELLGGGGFDERVVSHGPYPEGQAYVDLLSSYDLTLLPTVGDEGAPLVLLESMACGVPFVASGAGGVPDYGRANPDCVIARLRPDDFVADVRHMAGLLDRGEIDQARLQKHYQAHFGHEVLRRSWLEFLTHPGPTAFAWPGVGPGRPVVARRNGPPWSGGEVAGAPVRSFDR